MKKIILGLLIVCSISTIAYADNLSEKDLKQFYNQKDISKINPDITINVEYNDIMSLSDLVDIALKYSPQIHRALFAIEASERNIKKVKGTYTPYLSFYSGYGYANKNSQRNGYNSASEFMYGRIGINQLIYDFGTFSTNLKIAKNTHMAEEYQLSKVINNLIFDVRDKYFYYVYKNKVQKIYEEEKNDFDSMYKLVKAHYKSTSKEKNSKIEYDSNNSVISYYIDKSQKNIIDAKNEKEVAHINLNNIVGIPYAKNYEIKHESDLNEIKITPQNLLKVANENRPELKEAQKLIDISENRISLSKAQFTPSITGYGSFNIGGGMYDVSSFDNFNSVTAGVDINIPWISPISVYQEINQLKAMKNYEKADALQTAYNTYSEIQAAYISYSYSFSRYTRAKEQVDKNIVMLKNYTKMYSQGIDCFVHVAEFTEELADSKIKYAEAIYKLDSSKAQLDRAVGKIIVNKDL